jgi:hypothetical protein
MSQVLVAHACNPSYSRGRDQEDLGLKSVQIVRETLSRKNPSQKRAGGVAQGKGLEFKPQYCKRKEKERNLLLTVPKRKKADRTTGAVRESTRYHQEAEWRGRNESKTEAGEVGFGLVTLNNFIEFRGIGIMSFSSICPWDN